MKYKVYIRESDGSEELDMEFDKEEDAKEYLKRICSMRVNAILKEE